MELDLNSQFKFKRDHVKDSVEAVIIINLILAVVALARDMFLASYLGTSTQADAFWLAYCLPDMIGNNLLAAALGVACVPVFSKLCLAHEPDRLQSTVANITCSSLVLSFLLSLIIFLTRETIIHNLGAGLSAGTSMLCVALLIIILPSVVFFPLTSIGSTVLQVHNQFNIPALAPVLFNLVFLGGILCGYLRPVPVQQGVYLLAAAVLTGALVMVVLIWCTMKRYGFRIFERPRFTAFSNYQEDLREIFKIFFPYLLILLSSQVVYSVERYLASSLGVGTIAGLNYAFRIAQFPLWVFVSAVSTIAYPSMSKSLELGHMEEFMATFGKSLHLVLLITLPLTINIFILRIPVVTILFQRGSFDAHSIQITAGILAGYALTIVSQGVVVMCLRVFLAIGRALNALYFVIVSSGINILLDFLLVKAFGPAGLGYGAALGALVNALLLFYLLNKTMELKMKKNLVSIFKILAANLPVLLLAAFFYRLWYTISPHSGFSLKMGYAFIVVAACLPVYWASLRLLKIQFMS